MDANEITISQIADGHYMPEMRKRRRTNTVDGYESSIGLYVKPKWGGMTIDRIHRDDVQEWVEELSGTKAGPGGAWKAYKCLRQIIRWAMRKWGFYVADPTLGIEKPRGKAYKPDVLTPRRLKRLIRGFVGCDQEPSLIIEADLGTRPGECYVIHWEWINWRTGHVPINGTLQQASDGVKEWPTKTAKGERDGYLSPWALDRLHQIWIERGRPRGRIIGELKPSQVAYRIQRWIKKHRLPKITMKNLRHTWGTIAAQSGVAIETVSAMMGHSNIQTTYRYYYALTAATARKAKRKMAKSILGKTCSEMYRGIVLPIAPEQERIAA